MLAFLHRQSLIAGEWIVGGVDTKTISYAFAILSFSFFLRRRYLWGFAFAGAAMSFHVLVGCYALFCVAFATLLNRAWQSEWRLLFSRSWPLFITGCFGLLTVVNYVLPQSDVDATKAWELYVQYRVPHHVMPATWSGNLWVGKLILATGLFLFVYFASKPGTVRFAAAYALGSVSLFFLGLAIHSWGETHLLRYYWFRYPDVMIPFMSAVSIALLLDDISDGRLVIRAMPRRFRAGVRMALRRVAPIILISVAMLIIFHNSLHKMETGFRHLQQRKAETLLWALEWISRNTPRDEVFLVDPTIPGFYVHAQRAVFVSLTHSPQSAADILEWYERITLCNGSRFPERSGADALEELRTNFYNLDDDQIRQMAHSYGISYYLGLSRQPSTFERVYSNSDYALYRVSDTD
jgi:hypothetical protein